MLDKQKEECYSIDNKEQERNDKAKERNDKVKDEEEIPVKQETFIQLLVVQETNERNKSLPIKIRRKEGMDHRKRKECHKKTLKKI